MSALYTSDTSSDLRLLVFRNDKPMSPRQYRGKLPELVVLLTTAHRHPVHVEFGDDKTRYWKELWATDDVFYSTVAGFKGLERSVVVLAVDGFHEGADPRSVLYTGMNRARDLLILVGPSAVLSHYLPAKTMRRLGRGH